MKIKKFNEIYSEEDFKRGDRESEIAFGVEVKGRGKYRQDRLIIKKLVRLKYQLNDDNLKNQVDDILNLLDD